MKLIAVAFGGYWVDVKVSRSVKYKLRYVLRLFISD